MNDEYLELYDAMSTHNIDKWFFSDIDNGEFLVLFGMIFSALDDNTSVETEIFSDNYMKIKEFLASR